MKYIHRIIFTLKLAGTRGWYEGVDKPNFYQWIFGWRVSIKTAYKVAKIIWD